VVEYDVETLGALVAMERWPIIGQEQAASLLKKSIVGGHVAHAYLFSGPPHVGKATLARAFAQAMN
jgi:DNA polymerase III gamma/tau subunit